MFMIVSKSPLLASRSSTTRDGKQFTGLADCQARNAKSRGFAFNASLSAVNIAKALSIESGLNLSVEDVKLLIHNTVMVQRILSTFWKTPKPQPS